MRPVIFFTNGIDIFLWDDNQGYPYRKVYGFYSKDSLEYLVHQRTNKKALATIEPMRERGRRDDALAGGEHRDCPAPS